MDIEHERAVKNDRAKQFAKDLELAHYNVSAKTGEMVRNQIIVFFLKFLTSFIKFQLNASIMDIIRKHLGMPMSKVEKEYQQPIIRAELIPMTPNVFKKNNKITKSSHTAVCTIQ